MRARRCLGWLGVAALLLTGCAHEGASKGDAASTEALRRSVDQPSKLPPTGYCRSAMMTATTIVDCNH